MAVGVKVSKNSKTNRTSVIIFAKYKGQDVKKAKILKNGRFFSTMEYASNGEVVVDTNGSFVNWDNRD